MSHSHSQQRIELRGPNAGSIVNCGELSRPLADAGLGDLTFVESWRKNIVRSSRLASAAAFGEKARIELYIAPIHSLVRNLQCLDALSAEEASDISRIRVPSARDSKTAGRMLLRLALSRAVYNRILPKDWRLSTASDGRTKIADDLPQLRFSVSHTEQLAIVATSKSLPIGVDAESIEQIVESEVASFNCCPSEQAALQTLPSAHSTREFLRLWTLKEAYAKMVGLGSAIDFSTVGFSFETLNLSHLPEATKSDYHSHFETMFVSSGNGLSHLSLAVGIPSSVDLRAELQVLTLVSGSRASAIHLPCICPSPAQRQETVEA